MAVSNARQRFVDTSPMAADGAGANRADTFPCTPSPRPLRMDSSLPDPTLDSACKGPKVLRLVARPHAKIVPGMVASKEALAYAATCSSRSSAAASAPMQVVGMRRQQSREKRVASRSSLRESADEMTGITDDALWELVWQPVENLPAICAPPDDTTSSDVSEKKRHRRGRCSKPSSAGDDAESHPIPLSDYNVTSSPRALEVIPGMSSGRKDPQVASASPRTVRRRLRGKQPNPDLPCSGSRSRSPHVPIVDAGREGMPNGGRGSESPRRQETPRGHYDVLGLPRTASGSEIRAAYRRRALATHPDKCGDPDDFRRVVVAFEELGDESRRAAYDRNLELFGSRDGSGSPQPPPMTSMPCTPAPPTPAGRAGAWPPASWPEDIARWWYGAARVAMFKLMTMSRGVWSKQVVSMQDSELQALVDLLRGTKILVPDQSGDGEAAANRRRRRVASQEVNEAAEDEWSYQGIRRDRNGYRVVMSWANLSVSSNHTDSLAQAIDWQIALAWLRSTAQARLEECLGQAADPLIEEELMEVVAAEPAMNLTFAALVITRQGKKVQTIALPDLAKTLRFQALLRAAMAKSAKQLEQVKSKIDAEAEACLKQQTDQKKQLVAVCMKELQNRADVLNKEAPKKRPSSAAPPPRMSETLVPAMTFKPTRRVRSKSSPALLAILQGPSNLPAKSRQILSRACAWQGIPEPGSARSQPGTPCPRLALNDRPAFASPGTPFRLPGSPPRNSRRSKSRSPLRSPMASPSFSLSSPMSSSPPPRSVPRSPLRSPLPTVPKRATVQGSPMRSRSPLRAPMQSPLHSPMQSPPSPSPLCSPLRNPLASIP